MMVASTTAADDARTNGGRTKNAAPALELTAVVWMRKSPAPGGASSRKKMLAASGGSTVSSTSSVGGKSNSGSWERHRVALRGNELVHYRAAPSAASAAAAAAAAHGDDKDPPKGVGEKETDLATPGTDRDSSSNTSTKAKAKAKANDAGSSGGAESKSKSKPESPWTTGSTSTSTEKDPLLPKKLMRKVASAAKEKGAAGKEMAAKTAMAAIPPLKSATDNVKAAAYGAAEYAGLSSSGHSRSDDAYGAVGDHDAPRGTLDLSAAGNTAVIVVAQSPESVDAPPTPYVISVTGRDGTRRKGGETPTEETAGAEQQWTLCFDAQSRQMEWLSALTDVIVAVGVGTYNATMVARRGQERGTSSKSSATRLMPKLLRNKLPFQATKSTRQVTWDDYVVDSADGGGAGGGRPPMSPRVSARQLMEQGGEDDNSMEVAVVDKILPLGEHLYWLPRSPNLVVMLAFVNGAIFASAMVPGTMLVMCAVAVLANGGIWLCLVKKSPGVEMAILSSEDSTDADADVDDVLPTVMAMTSRAMSRKSIMDAASAVGEKVASTIVPSLIAESSHRPQAGTSTMRIANPTDPAVNEDGQPFAGWRAMPGSLFRVRSHGYAATKTKVPSPSELYDLAHVDIFESGSRCPDIAEKVRLPEVSFGDENDAGNQPTKTWCSPDVFVVSFALPTKAPRIGSPTEDGEGYTVTMYYIMKKQTREVLRRIMSPDGTAKNTDGEDEHTDVQKRVSNGVRLWEEWCRRAPTDPEYQARFKVICNAHNLKEIGVPSWIARYNEKPFLIKRAGKTGFLYTHPELSAMEFDISFHCFPYVFKQGASYLKEHYFNKILVTFGFCIEGRDDEELPEIMIGEGMQLCYPDPAIAMQAGDWFGGSSPVSFEVEE